MSLRGLIFQMQFIVFLSPPITWVTLSIFISPPHIYSIPLSYYEASLVTNLELALTIKTYMTVIKLYFPHWSMSEALSLILHIHLSSLVHMSSGPACVECSVLSIAHYWTTGLNQCLCLVLIYSPPCLDQAIPTLPQQQPSCDPINVTIVHMQKVPLSCVQSWSYFLLSDLSSPIRTPLHSLQYPNSMINSGVCSVQSSSIDLHDYSFHSQWFRIASVLHHHSPVCPFILDPWWLSSLQLDQCHLVINLYDIMSMNQIFMFDCWQSSIQLTPWSPHVLVFPLLPSLVWLAL